MFLLLPNKKYPTEIEISWNWNHKVDDGKNIFRR